jgi:hypothetical protein
VGFSPIARILESFAFFLQPCLASNLSINKYVREETDAINQNDTWHCVKSMKTPLKKVASGTLPRI